MRRLLLSLLTALTVSAAAAATAIAGGSAIVIPDEGNSGGGGVVTDEPIAGEPITVGFTLLQHGVTPVEEGTVEVLFDGPGGALLATEAVSTGDGHWIATATLPSDGEWSWTARMPSGLEIVPMRDPPSLVVGTAPGPLSVPLIAGGLVAGFAALLAMLVLAARSTSIRSRPEAVRRTA